jgi:hypothetical protein
VNWITPFRFRRTSFQTSTTTVVAAVDETLANASRIMCNRNGTSPMPSAPFRGLFRVSMLVNDESGTEAVG